MLNLPVADDNEEEVGKRADRHKYSKINFTQWPISAHSFSPGENALIQKLFDQIPKEGEDDKSMDCLNIEEIFCCSFWWNLSDGSLEVLCDELSGENFDRVLEIPQSVHKREIRQTLNSGFPFGLPETDFGFNLFYGGHWKVYAPALKSISTCAGNQVEKSGAEERNNCRWSYL